jgi:hypothetical protein
MIEILFPYFSSQLGTVQILINTFQHLIRLETAALPIIPKVMLGLAKILGKEVPVVTSGVFLFSAWIH